MASNPKFEDKGRLWMFTNTYKSNPSQPDLTGGGEISGAVIKELAKYYNDNKPEDGLIQLSCAAWDRKDKNGKNYKFVTFEIKKPREANRVPDGSTSEPKEEDDIPF